MNWDGNEKDESLGEDTVHSFTLKIFSSIYYIRWIRRGGEDSASRHCGNGNGSDGGLFFVHFRPKELRISYYKRLIKLY